MFVILTSVNVAFSIR